MGMTIDEAIKDLQAHTRKESFSLYGAHEQAQLLGIEALNFVKANRERGYAEFEVRLPGETEE